MLLELLTAAALSVSPASTAAEGASLPNTSAVPVEQLPLSVTFQARDGTLRALVDGPLSVVTWIGGPHPRNGFAPLRLRVKNDHPKAVPVEFELAASAGSSTVRREVQLAPGERRTLVIPVPASVRHGVLTVSSPVLQKPASEFLTASQERSTDLLFVGLPEDTARWLGERPDPNAYSASVGTFTVPAEELWEDFSAYSGFHAIILAGAQLAEVPQAHDAPSRP